MSAFFRKSRLRTWEVASRRPRVGRGRLGNETLTWHVCKGGSEERPTDVATPELAPWEMLRMYKQADDWQDLAARVGTDDSAALARLRRELEPQMVRIVRRAIGRGNRRSALAQRIHVTAERFSRLGPDHPAEDREWLIGQVARHMCDTLLGGTPKRPAGGQWLKETVRM
jgi:hypothetical protein